MGAYRAASGRGSVHNPRWQTVTSEAQLPVVVDRIASPAPVAAAAGEAGRAAASARSSVARMNPGTPVSTTGLNRMFVVMLSRISRMASSGRAEMSKILSDTIRFGRTHQDRGSALHGPGERNLSRRLADALGDAFDHGVVDDSGR